MRWAPASPSTSLGITSRHCVSQPQVPRHTSGITDRKPAHSSFLWRISHDPFTYFQTHTWAWQRAVHPKLERNVWDTSHAQHSEEEGPTHSRICKWTLNKEHAPSEDASVISRSRDTGGTHKKVKRSFLSERSSLEIFWRDSCHFRSVHNSHVWFGTAPLGWWWNSSTASVSNKLKRHIPLFHD